MLWRRQVSTPNTGRKAERPTPPRCASAPKVCAPRYTSHAEQRPGQANAERGIQARAVGPWQRRPSKPTGRSCPTQSWRVCGLRCADYCRRELCKHVLWLWTTPRRAHAHAAPRRTRRRCLCPRSQGSVCRRACATVSRCAHLPPHARQLPRAPTCSCARASSCSAQERPCHSRRPGHRERRGAALRGRAVWRLPRAARSRSAAACALPARARAPPRRPRCRRLSTSPRLTRGRA